MLAFFELPEKSASPFLWAVKVPLTVVLLSSVLLTVPPSIVSLTNFLGVPSVPSYIPLIKML